MANNNSINGSFTTLSVSSIREVSIVLATLLSFYLLKEKDAKKRVIPSIIIFIGVTILYFQIK